MSRKQRLELTWIGKEAQVRLEPRVLILDESLSHHASTKKSEAEKYDNMLIFGDNLLALRALEHDFKGQIKCIFIDPPYNTGSAFTHYDDGLEHSVWLSLISARISILYHLLCEEGTIWISIDDNEAHYLKVVLDEQFGRQNFVANIIWEKRYAPANDSIWFSDTHDHILVYAKNKSKWRPNRLTRQEKTNKAYGNPDADPRGLWRPDNYTCSKTADERPNLYYPIRQPNTGETIWPSRTRVWAYSQETHAEHVKTGLIYWERMVGQRFRHSRGS